MTRCELIDVVDNIQNNRHRDGVIQRASIFHTAYRALKYTFSTDTRVEKHDGEWRLYPNTSAVVHIEWLKNKKSIAKKFGTVRPADLRCRGYVYLKL